MTAFAFPGLNLALATPFDEAGRIDLDRLEQNIERYLAAGIQGFVLSSGTGMHVYLSPEEAGQVIERGAKVINGRARIIAPRACQAVVRAAVEGRWSDARAAWARLEPIMSLIWEGNYVQAVYAAADLTGHGAGSPRKPLRALPGDRIAAIREALGDLIQSERAI